MDDASLKMQGWAFVCAVLLGGVFFGLGGMAVVFVVLLGWALVTRAINSRS